VRAVAVVFGLAAVLTTAVVLRLLAGPIDLELLRPHLPNEFDTPDGPVRVTAEHIYVEWGALKDPMRLVFTGLHVIDVHRREIATAPSVALSFEPRSVVLGHLLPTAVVVNRPTLDADIAREGGMLRRVLASADSGSQGEFFDLLIEQLLAEHNHHSMLGQLDTVEVTNARISLRDVPSGLVWIAPAAQARLKRDTAGVAITAQAQFISATTREPIEVRLSGTYSRDRSRIFMEVGLDGMKPSMLADLSSDALILRGLDIALSGNLRIEATGGGEIKTVAMEVTAGAGTITLPGVLPASHKVRSVNALAHIDVESHSARIDHIEVDLGAARIAITGTGLRTEQGQTFSGRAELKGVPVDKVGDYWPLDFAPGGRAWALANLSGGTLDIAAEFSVSTPGHDLAQLKIDRNVAFLDYRDMTVHYMPHMPELQNVSGKARFEGGTLHFDVASGTAVGLTVTGATIDMTGLDGPPPHHAALRMPIKGSAPAVIALLARPKLGLPRDVLYDPKRVGGDVAIELALDFPLINTLAVADIDIRADAAVSGMSLHNAIGKIDLTGAAGHVVYANSQLNVTGVGKLDGHPVDIVWREQFAPRAPYRQRYELKGTIPAALIGKAGFPSPEPYVSGPLGVTSLSYQVATNGTSELHGRFDLKGAQLAVAPLGWSKDSGTEGQLTLTMKLAPGAKLTTADFESRANGLAAKGQVRFGADNSVQQISIGQISLGATDIAAEWRRGPTGVDVTLRGRSLEYSRVRQMLKARDELASATPGSAAATARESTRFTVQLERFVLERGSLGSVRGRLDLSGDRIASAELGIGAGKGATFRVTPAGQARNVSVYVANFGQLMTDTGWLDGFVGGDLDLRGRFDDTQVPAPLSGKLKLGPYRLEKVTPRANVGTLNSTIDALGRAGNSLQQFDSLEAAIKKVGDRIELKNGRTSGKSIGLTTAGTIDVAADQAHLRGVVVPGFALNNALSNVPLLGPLLTGGKDGGVFAVAYRLDGPLGDLKTDVNMMSAMTPGALREIFTGTADGAPAKPETPSDRAP
jgi:hypothetical protein